MSMHIEGPWLNMTGKRKGKVKYKSAEAKRQAEQLSKEWETLKNKYKSDTKVKNVSVKSPVVSSTVRNHSDDRPKSLNSWVTGAVAVNKINSILVTWLRASL